MMRNFLLVTGCLLALVSLGQASPITLFDSIEGGSVPTAGLNALYFTPYYTEFYASFSTTSSPFVLQDVALLLGGASDDDGVLDVDISPDLNGAGESSEFASGPDTSTFLGSISDATIFADGQGVYDLSGLGVALAANSTYWIGVNSLGNSDVPASAMWAYATDLTNASADVPNEYAYDQSDGVFQNGPNDFAQQMTISGSEGASTPEPAPFLLSALGIGSLIFLRRRRSTV